MKNCKAVLFTLVLFLLPVYSYSQPQSAPPPPSTLGVLRTSLIEGDVQIKTVDTGDWVPASINMPLKEGDELWVPEAGRMELQLNTGTYVRLDLSSSLSVMTVKKNSSQFYMAQGHTYVNFNAPRGNVLQLDTPVSSIRVYDRAIFRVDVTEQGYTDISVFAGAVYAESKGGNTTINSGKMLSLREETYAELIPLGQPDDWENWNVERDKRVFVRRDGGRYLPPELATYSSDFDSNGRWVMVKEYGYVWTPSVVVAAEWAPYRVGRWTWVGGDYCWVSYEPWGWAPYHYGRWAHLGAVGWFWVPPVRGAVYWGPGFVGWVQTPTYVSWVPLAPGEIYYGHGYYGPHSVNIVNVTNINITNITYRNIHVHNGITIVNHDTFLHGHHWGGRLPPDGPLRYTDASIRENPFLTHGIHAGRPTLTPDRASMVPFHREISKTHLPPDRIRAFNVGSLRSSRPLVTDRNASVINRGATVRPLDVRTREGRGVERPWATAVDKSARGGTGVRGGGPGVKGEGLGTKGGGPGGGAGVGGGGGAATKKEGLGTKGGGPGGGAGVGGGGGAATKKEGLGTKGGGPGGGTGVRGGGPGVKGEGLGTKGGGPGGGAGVGGGGGAATKKEGLGTKGGGPGGGAGVGGGGGAATKKESLGTKGGGPGGGAGVGGGGGAATKKESLGDERWRPGRWCRSWWRRRGCH